MKLFRLFIPLFCFLSISLYAYEVIDANASKLSFNEPPETVASISPSTTELIFALKADQNLVANSRYCRFPEKAKEKIKIGGFIDPDLEKIAQLKPDLFILSRSKNDIFSSKLDSLGIKHLSLYEEGLENILKNIEILGEVFQKQENAKALVLEIEKSIANAKEKSKGLNSKKAIMLFGQMAAANGSYAGELLPIAGFENIMANSATAWLVPQKEHILISGVEVIILEAKSDADFEKELNFYKSDPIWSKTKAVKNSQIYPINSDLISIPCTHIIGAIGRLSQILQEAQ